MLPTTQIEGLIPRIQKASSFAIDIRKIIEEDEIKLKTTGLYERIELNKKYLKEFEEEEIKLREQGKQIMLDNGLKKFEMLD